MMTFPEASETAAPPEGNAALRQSCAKLHQQNTFTTPNLTTPSETLIATVAAYQNQPQPCQAWRKRSSTSRQATPTPACTPR